MTRSDIAELGKKTRFKSGPKQIKIARKGGLGNKNNPKTILGQKLRYLREHGFNDKTKERMYELLQNPAFSRMDLLNYLESVRKEKGLTTETKLKVLAAIRDVSKMIHGTRENDAKHLVMDLKLSTEEKKREIKRLLKD